jgi:hypothetical protein
MRNREKLLPKKSLREIGKQMIKQRQFIGVIKLLRWRSLQALSLRRERIINIKQELKRHPLLIVSCF